jgi:cyanuric acid amidohydrolase
MPIAKVHRISAASPDDVSGIEAAIAAKQIDPKGVVAVLGKTEGNGLVNDYARGYAAFLQSKIMGVFFAAKLRHGSTRTCSAAWSRCAH